MQFRKEQSGKLRSGIYGKLRFLRKIDPISQIHSAEKHIRNISVHAGRVNSALTDGMEAVEDRARAAKTHAAMAGIAVAASAGLLAAGLFSSPADLVRNQNAGTLDRAFTPAFEQLLREDEQEEKEKEKEKEKTEDSGNGGGAGSSAGDGNGEAEASPDPDSAESLRNRILQIPVWIRTLAGVPVWCLGWVILQAGKLLLGSILSPVVSTVLGWLLTAVLLLAAVLAVVKAVCPDLPLRKILNRKVLGAVALAVALLAAADTAAQWFWPEYSQISGILHFCGPIIAAGFISFRILRKKHRQAMPAHQKRA